jgi:tRNA threonylcarbamoyladenosine biosynthesis protein TsaB
VTPPLILAIDTTHEYGSLALARGMDILEEVEIHAPTGFAQVLYGALGGLLERQGVSVAEVDRFAAASGPGSFTGVRVGLACVKGLAEAVGKPAVAVSTLEAIARFGKGPLRAALLDARRGDVYAAVFDADGRLVVPGSVGKLDVFLGVLPKREVVFVSPDFTAFGDALPDAPRVLAPRALAGSIAQIACEREPQDPATLDANYVRRSDAELFWKDY